MFERKEIMMNPLPKETMDYGDLYQILAGSIKTRLMMAGIELNIFDQLGTFRSCKDVARELGTHPGNTGVLLDALVTIDLLEKKKGLYRNLPITQTFLSQASSGYRGGMFQMIEARCVESLKDLTRLVKGGPEGADGEQIWLPRSSGPRSPGSVPAGSRGPWVKWWPGSFRNCQDFPVLRRCWTWEEATAFLRSIWCATPFHEGNRF